MKENLLYTFDKELYSSEYVESLSQEECDRLTTEHPHNVIKFKLGNDTFEHFLNSYFFCNDWFYVRIFN